jgi:hypothetical protein
MLHILMRAHAPPTRKPLGDALTMNFSNVDNANYCVVDKKNIIEEHNYTHVTRRPI